MAVTAEPIWFGSEERPLFGWLHRPDAGRTAQAGLLICNAFGNEGMCAHRTIRQLAVRAARAGLAVLRFDYDGTGDSAGHSFEGQRVGAWLASMHSAADTLKHAAGITRLYVAGFRLGATLAALACLERSDVRGLIAIVPVVNGAAYVRELRLLQRAIEARRDIAHREDAHYLESAGFLLTVEAQASLKRLDLTRLPRAPCPNVLVLDRAEMPIDLALVPALRERGSTVDRISARGHTEMMLDPHESVVPEEFLGAILKWLDAQERAAGAAPAAPAEPSAGPPTRQSVTLAPPASVDPTTGPAPAVAVEETLVRVGGDLSLFGILSAPSGGPPSTAQPGAVLLLNAGAVHHIGPNRLYVILARHLARLGHTVLRMDIAGIGDSEPRPGEPQNVVYPQAALDDVGHGLDFLRRERRVHAVCALGLCSGAYHAFKAAVAHLPLEAAVVVNPLTFFYKAGMSLAYPQHRVAADMLRYRTNAFSLAAWRRLLAGQVNLWQLGGVLARHALNALAGPVHAAARTIGRPFPDDLPTELGHVARAGIALQFVFADGDPGLELLRQGGGSVARRMLARHELSVTVIPEADHTYTDLSTRVALLEVLTRAVQRSPRTAPAPVAQPLPSAASAVASGAVPAVVVGGAVNGLGCVRSLARANLPVYLVDTERASAARWSRHCTFVATPSLEGAPLVATLQALATRLGGRPVLFLTSDELVATVCAHREELEPLYRSSLPATNVVKVLTDKALFQTLAAREGLPVPRAVEITGSADLAKLESLRPPYVLKAAQRVRSGSGAHAVRAPTLEAAHAAAAALLPVAPHLIAQEWLEGPDTEIYFTLFACDGRGRLAGVFAGRRLVSDPPAVGATTVCIAAPEVADELARHTQHFVTRVGYRGLGSLEFKRDVHTGRFLIIGPTVGRIAGYEEIATLCGINIPLLAYEAELGRTPRTLQHAAPVRIAWRATREHRELPESMHPATRIVDGYFRWDDPLPAVFQYGYRRLRQPAQRAPHGARPPAVTPYS